MGLGACMGLGLVRILAALESGELRVPLSIDNEKITELKPISIDQVTYRQVYNF